MLLNKAQDGKSHRLDPVCAKQVSDHMNEVLRVNGGTMTKDAFREFVLGNPENKAFLVPEIS